MDRATGPESWAEESPCVVFLELYKVKKTFNDLGMQTPTESGSHDFKKRLIVPQIVIGTLAASTFIYGVVLNELKQGNHGSRALEPTLLPFFAALALVIAVAGINAPKLILRSALKKLPAEDGSLQRFTAWFNSVIIRGALFEAVAVIGFMAALTFSAKHYYPFWAASALLQLFFFPTEQRFKSETRELKRL